MTITKKVIEAMWKFQEQNGITGRCIANASYLLAIAEQDKEFPFAPKAKAVFADSGNMITIHILLSLGEDCLIDPSFEIHRLKPQYYDRLCQLSKQNIYRTPDGSDLDKKVWIAKYLQFLDIEERLNDGKIPSAFQDYNNEQHEYVLSVLTEEEKEQLHRMILPVYLDGDEVEVVSEHLKKLNHKE
jgi:hypothetical protein